MELTEQFDLPFARAAVWAAFQNLDMLVQCLPGASLTSPADQVPLEMSFQLRMGPVQASFTGQGSVAYEPTTFSGSFSGQGTDRKNNSRVKGEARFALLEAAGPVTTVQVVVAFTLTGALAQFSRLGIVREIAAGITAQFAANLQRELATSDDVAGASGSAVASAGGTEPAAAAHGQAQPAPRPDASLNLMALLWQLVVQRFRRLFS